MPIHRPPVQGTASTVLAALAVLPATGCVPNAVVPDPAYATNTAGRDALAARPAACQEETR